jgi:nucleotide-binding universal stress UspA family protein
MQTIHKILHPTDFSSGADPAAELAIEMARKYGAELLLLHAHSPPIYIGAFGDAYAAPPDVIDKLQSDVERALHKLHERAEGAGIRTESITVDGIASDVILAVARSHHIDLIVMGTHGRTGLKHFLLGSVAERVVRTADCPVMTVRAPPPPPPR